MTTVPIYNTSFYAPDESAIRAAREVQDRAIQLCDLTAYWHARQAEIEARARMAEKIVRWCDAGGWGK